MADTMAGTNQGTPVMSTAEILGRLRKLRSDLDQRLVITWLRDRREDPQAVADAVALMAEIADVLNGEVDLFIGSTDQNEAGEPGRSEQDIELTDLQNEGDGEHHRNGFLS